MLYLLPGLLLLFVVSFGNEQCNSIIYTDAGGEKVGVPTGNADKQWYNNIYLMIWHKINDFIIYLGICQIEESSSSKYVCADTDNGTTIDLNRYSSRDCSGNPLGTSLKDICTLYPNDCTEICDQSNCDGITETYYKTIDCSGDIKTKKTLLPGICNGDSTFSTKLTCSGGTIQVNKYVGSADCSKTPASSLKYNEKTCAMIGSISGEYEGCDESSTSKTTFTLFSAIITIFIISSF